MRRRTFLKALATAFGTAWLPSPLVTIVEAEPAELPVSAPPDRVIIGGVEVDLLSCSINMVREIHESVAFGNWPVAGLRRIEVKVSAIWTDVLAGVLRMDSELPITVEVGDYRVTLKAFLVEYSVGGEFMDLVRCDLDLQATGAPRFERR